MIPFFVDQGYGYDMNPYSLWVKNSTCGSFSSISCQVIENKSENQRANMHAACERNTSEIVLADISVNL